MRPWYPELTHSKEEIRALTEAAPRSSDRRVRFGMRDEQAAAVAATARYFRQHAAEKGRLRFLWNAKMRFGKTFAAYKLAEEMGWTRILVLTYKPAVQDAWASDLKNHEDFAGWSFIGNRDLFRGDTVPEQTVWMSSYQALFSRNADGEAPARLDLLFSTDWDAIFIDEYHCKCWIKIPQKCWRKFPHLSGSAISRADDWRLRSWVVCHVSSEAAAV